jgi:hypothetical protein
MFWVLYLLFLVHTDLFLLNENGGWQLELLDYTLCVDINLTGGGKWLYLHRIDGIKL